MILRLHGGRYQREDGEESIIQIIRRNSGGVVIRKEITAQERVTVELAQVLTLDHPGEAKEIGASQTRVPTERGLLRAAVEREIRLEKERGIELSVHHPQPQRRVEVH